MISIIPPIWVSDRKLLHSGSIDFLGRKVFSDVILKWNGKRIVFLDAIVTITQDINIVKTSLAGRSGTVKEYVSSDDYEVKIEASINSGDKYEFPVDKTRDLITLLNAGEQIEVISEFIAMFDIQYLVCRRARLSQISGTQNMQKVEMDFLSDKDIQLVIDEEGD
jgi:hypothetical protein